MITGIVVALPEELSTLTRTKIPKGDCYFLNPTLVVAYAGAGPENASAATKLLIANGATQLISWGCAAALSETLKPGDLTLAKSLMNANSERDHGFRVTAAWHKQCETILSQLMTVHACDLIESKRIVSDSGEKKRLGMAAGAFVLDMESIAVATIAQQHDCAFIAIRAIADPVNMSLPKAVSYAMSEQGDVLMGKLLRYLCLHPSELLGLLKLGLHFNSAQNTLKKVATQLNSITAYQHSMLAAS